LYVRGYNNVSFLEKLREKARENDFSLSTANSFQRVHTKRKIADVPAKFLRTKESAVKNDLIKLQTLSPALGLCFLQSERDSSDMDNVIMHSELQLLLCEIILSLLVAFSQRQICEAKERAPLFAHPPRPGAGILHPPPC
jgi:hypothetical protein